MNSFKKKKHDANRLGLNVMDDTEGKHLNVLNRLSFDVMKKTDNRPTSISETDLKHTIMPDNEQVELVDWLNSHSDGSFLTKFVKDEHCIELFDIF